MNIPRAVALLITLTCFAEGECWVYAQCSDAGVCVIGRDHRSGHSVGLDYLFGSSGKDSTITIHTARLRGRYRVSENASLELALPVSLQGGPAGKTGAIGDVTLLWRQTILHDGGMELEIQGGVKLATGTVNGGNLPQAYQSGLGTNDFLLGGSYMIHNLTFAAAYQLTTGRSANSVTRLQRGDDLMLRAGYNTSLEPWTVGGELIAIKRLRNSSVLQSTQPETFITVPNSNQLQVNLTGQIQYTADEQYVLRAEGALALLRRDTNLDGLKRAFTLSIGADYRF